MYGALIGDMIGSRFEFTQLPIRYEFELLNRKCRFTDDTVMSIAVAEALLETEGKDDETVRQAIVSSMQKWGRKYPNAGYGGNFYDWIFAGNPKPYHSYGNGSAMRVSSAAWLNDSLEEVLHDAKLSAEVTHNHPKGIKGAEAIAAAIYLAGQKSSKEEIRDYCEKQFGYDLSVSYDSLKKAHIRSAVCQDTVPEAIIAFLEGESFEDVIRKAVVLGGDTDTIAAMAGSIAEAYYGIDEELKERCVKRLPEEMKAVLTEFDRKVLSRKR